MFGKEEGGEGGSAMQQKAAQTVIGPTVKVEGSFHSDDNILIDGQVVGTVKTSKDLTVGPDSRIEADVTAENMHISGEVKGNLHASGTITLTSSARVYGDVETSIISVETGAVLQGRCVTGGNSAPTIDVEEENTGKESGEKKK